jgi:hypothetical protein
MAKNRMTFEKTQREAKKKRKAEEKRAQRRKKREGGQSEAAPTVGPPTDSQSIDDSSDA